MPWKKEFSLSTKKFFHKKNGCKKNGLENFELGVTAFDKTQCKQLLEETTSISASSQWRKVQEMLDEDPRYSPSLPPTRLIPPCHWHPLLLTSTYGGKFPGISGDLREFPGISENFWEFYKFRVFRGCLVVDTLTLLMTLFFWSHNQVLHQK